MWTLLLVVFATGSPALLQAAPVQGEKRHDDILMEVETEGFLVDLEEILGRVKRDTSVQNDTPKTDIMKPSTVPALEKLSKTTHNEDSQRPTNKPHFGKSSVAPSVFDTEGSGSAFEIWVTDPEPRQFTTTTIATDIDEKPIKQNRGTNLDVSSEGLIPKISSENKSKDKQAKDDGPSTWLIIFAFCVVVGAIVCILAAIATRDKWYGPRESRNITTEVHNKDYSKTETLPLSEKEQEVVALMSVTKLNGKTDEITATSLEEHEKEYLM